MWKKSKPNHVKTVKTQSFDHGEYEKCKNGHDAKV